MTLDVSDGPASSGLVSCSHRRLDLCLKRPSFNCLIHFYKRCVSSLALVSQNLLYSGLKKAHSKKEIIQQEMCCGYSDIPGGKKLLPAGWKLAHDHSCLRKRPSSAFTSPGMSTWSPPAWSIGSDSVSQSVCWPQKANLCKMSTATCIPRRSPIQVLTGLNLA